MGFYTAILAFLLSIGWVSDEENQCIIENNNNGTVTVTQIDNEIRVSYIKTDDGEFIVGPIDDDVL